MVKRCIVCGEEAKYQIKDTSDYYCEDCAGENFADISMLLEIEGEANHLKELLKQKLDEMESHHHHDPDQDEEE